jgi:hypothetical protein
MLSQFIRTLYCVCCDFHSGQWSKGYELLCLCTRYAEQWGISLPLDGTYDLSQSERELYNKLTEKYAHRL